MNANKMRGLMLHLLVSSIFILDFVTHVSLQEEAAADEECFSCSSKECLHRANMLTNSMKLGVDPCEDFYSFACGGYMEKFGKEDTKSVYDDTWYSLQVLIKDLLDSLQPPTGSASAKLKTMYDTCMKSESSELKAVSSALEFLNVLGIPDWPHLDSNFIFPKNSLSEVLGKLSVYGEFAFISFKPSPYGEKNSNVISLPSALILPDNFLLNSKLIPGEIRNTVMRVLAFFGVMEDAANSIWKDFEAIERTFMGLQTEDSRNCKDGANAMYAEVNCTEEMQESLKFVCELWKSAVENEDLKKHYSGEIIHIPCRWNQYHYIENIYSSLANFTQRSVAHYLALRFFIAHLDDLNLYFQLVKKANSGVKGSKQRSTESMSRWEYCIGWTIKSMNYALGYEFTQKVLTEAMQNDILNLMDEYLEDLQIRIQEQNWINDRVKSFLKHQLEKLDIGFKTTMQIYRNETYVSNYYREFQPVNGSFLKSILEFRKISNIFNKKDKHFNSFYSSSDPYTMDFGLTLFLPPIYSYGMPKLWNYAAVGYVIAHELSHNLKFLFDLVELDDETGNSINEKINCYRQQYSQFLLDKIGKLVNPKEFEEEIAADNIGWSLTESILQKYISDTRDKLHLPGIEYTPRQLVYIAFAQVSCEVLSKSVENELWNSNPQNVEKLRVLGVLQNSRTFSEAFNCSINSHMNRPSKCSFLE